MPGYDLLLRGGSVVDGTGGAPRRADIAVRGGRLVVVGEVPPDATAHTDLDVTGRYLLPGFVDAHVHADAQIFEPATQLATLRQGVTTLIVGQDGVSFAPSTDDTFHYVKRYFDAVNGYHDALPQGGCSVADLLGSYDRATPLNVAYLAPHGTIRHAVLGSENRPASADELRGMRTLLEGALSDGAVGLSTGLQYLPGAFADTAELIELCRVVAEAGGVYVTHMRAYETEARTGMEEVYDIARASGCAAHVSHYHGPAGLLVPLIDDGLARGLELSFDTYPYLRSSSILAMSALPVWLQEDGPEAALDRLQDREVRKRLSREWFHAIRETVLAHATLSSIPTPEFSWAEGMSLPQAAERAGVDIDEFVCDLFVASRMQVGCVLPHPANSNESLRQLLRHPAHMAGSDGIYVGGHPHPRGAGTFARYLGVHTRLLGDYDWGEAAVHLASRAARRHGLRDRGVLCPGYAADVVVLDPGKVDDRATYAAPRRAAIGVDHVIVGGQIVLRFGQRTRNTPGRALRPTSHPAEEP